MIDLSNVTAIALGAEDVLQIQDAFGAVLWQKVIYYNVSISAGSNGSVSVNGVSGDYSQSVAAGTVLTIEGTGTTGYDFDTWSDGNTDNPRTITVTGDLTLTASFAQAVLANYFYIEDISGSANTLTITKANNYAPSITPYVSTDQQTWTSMGTTAVGTPITATVPANGKLYIKCTADSWGYETNASQQQGWHTMSFTGNHNVGGNIMSLLYGDNFEGQTSVNTNYNCQFMYLFRNDTYLLDASDLELPALTLSRDTYGNMFKGCTNLTAVTPVLPATSSNVGAYISMFENCSSLVEAPVLMLTYIKAYDLYTMFKGCTLIDKIVTYANTVENYGTTNWLQNVAATGDFYALGSYNWTINSPSGVPTGWTLHHSLPVPCNVSISAGSNGTVSVNGVSGDYSDTVMSDTVLTLAATADNGYYFTGWSDGNTSASRTITVTADLTLTASFAQVVNFNVSVSAGNNGSVSVNGVSGDYSQSVPAGTVLTLVATPDSGYELDSWSDGDTNTTRTVTITADTTLTASFVAAPEYKIKATYYVDSPSTNVHILNSTTGVTSMEIDGVTMSPSTYKVLGSTQTDYKSVWFTLSSSTVDVGSMFVNIEKLSSITIGENITGIAKTGVTLNNYVWFKTVLVESGNTVFDERGWGCVETATNTLVLGGGATTIDATVTTIGEKALAGVAYRTNMSGSSMDYLNWTIPATVTAIGDNAFWGTPKINTLNLYGRPTVGTNALEHFGDNNSTLHIVTGTSIAGTVWKTELVDNRQTGYVWTICADL